MGGNQLCLVLHIFFPCLGFFVISGDSLCVPVLEYEENTLGMVVAFASYFYVHCHDSIPEVK
jgi:hypothetical protein